MPEIGEIKKGAELNFRSGRSNKFIWYACSDCGVASWKVMWMGAPRNKRCRVCANKELRKQLKEKVCQHCGEKFMVRPWRDGLAKFCSIKCHRESKHANRSSKAYDKQRVCQFCKKGFLPTQWNQKYCNRECWKADVSREFKHVCPSCGREFLRTRKASKFCSRECSATHHAKSGTRVKRGYLDMLWSELVKLRAGKRCEYCGKPNALNSHHIFSKSRASLRWDIDNGICLCASHHLLGNFSAHKAPIDFVEWLKGYRGQDWYDHLRAKAQVSTQHSPTRLKQIAEALRTQIKEYAV